MSTSPVSRNSSPLPTLSSVLAPAPSSSSATSFSAAGDSDSSIQSPDAEAGSSVSMPNPYKRKALVDEPGTISEPTPRPPVANSSSAVSLVQTFATTATKDMLLITLTRQVSEYEAHILHLERTIISGEKHAALRTQERDDAVQRSEDAHKSLDESSHQIEDLEETHAEAEAVNGILRLQLLENRSDTAALHATAQANGAALGLMRQAAHRHQQASEELRVLVTTLTAALARDRRH